MPISENDICRLAAECGFEQCGVATVEPLTAEGANLKNWLASGHHGSMQYMERNLDKRIDPRLLLPEVRSVVVVLMNYFPAVRQPDGQPVIATYAYGHDYHYIVRSRLQRLAEQINAIEPHLWTVYSDSAPVMERTWAVRAGLGWIGRCGMLVNPTLGTYSLIGIMFTSLSLPESVAMPDRCGHCRRCLDSCPTSAIDEQTRTIDSRRCISYLTIESRTPIPDEYLPAAGNILYGCDRCMSVCPWNRFAHPTRVPELQPLPGIFDIDWHTIGRGAFNRLLKHSAMQRAGHRKIRDRAIQIQTLIQTPIPNT